MVADVSGRGAPGQPRRGDTGHTPLSGCICRLDRSLRGNLTFQRKGIQWEVANKEGKEGDTEGKFWDPGSMRPHTHSLEKVHRVLPWEATRLAASTP